MNLGLGITYNRFKERYPSCFLMETALMHQDICLIRKILSVIYFL